MLNVVTVANNNNRCECKRERVRVYFWVCNCNCERFRIEIIRCVFTQTHLLCTSKNKQTLVVSTIEQQIFRMRNIVQIHGHKSQKAVFGVFCLGIFLVLLVSFIWDFWRPFAQHCHVICKCFYPILQCWIFTGQIIRQIQTKYIRTLHKKNPERGEEKKHTWT